MKISGHREYILHVDELEFEHYSQKKLRQQQRAHRKSHNMRMQLEITSQKREATIFGKILLGNKN